MSNWHSVWVEKCYGDTSPATQDTPHFFLLPTQGEGCYEHSPLKKPTATLTELMIKRLHPTDHSLPIQQPLSDPLIELWAWDYIITSTLSLSRLRTEDSSEHSLTQEPQSVISVKSWRVPFSSSKLPVPLWSTPAHHSKPGPGTSRTFFSPHQPQ